jgi:hypothetical protein
MAILQHYYTSFVNKETGSAGFQVKAMSPGISPDRQSMISRLIAYRIPPTLNEYEIERHPIALRYYYKDPQESILLCSQSNGSDENGRPGNFFAHTLVMEPDVFTTVPPILYWRSPFWCSQDPDTRTELMTMPSFDIEPSLDIEQVWDFLAQDQHTEQFYKLMCATVHSNKMQRRIVIIDSADNIALWIAAVSCMLPPPYRPLLSFATYHHDPYQAQFMITGTTSDSSFRATPDFFILNTEADMMSGVEDSPYARMAAGATRPDLYEQRLLPLFAMSMRLFPLPTGIDEQLDLVAQYFALTQLPRQEPLTIPELQAARLALSGFEQLSSYDEDDVEDLRRLARALSAAFKSQRDDDDFVEEWRVLVPKILTSPLLAPLLGELETSLYEMALSALSLSRFSSAEVELCKIYRNNTSLPEEIRLVIGGILAMWSGQLDQDLASRLHQHFGEVSLMMYQEEVKKFMTEFFKVLRLELGAHSLMVSALYTITYNDIFWQSYWSVFMDMLTTPARAERATEVLALWFEFPPAQPHMSYVAQSFFFALPQKIEDARKVRGFFETARKINACAEQYQWYPLVQPFFSERKNMITSICQNLALRFQRRNQNSKEAQTLAQKQACDAKVAVLFERKRIKASHTQHLPTLYSLQQRDQFWSAYWEGFRGVLISRDADYALELLSFWFDDSFEDLERVPHVVQDFFLGLLEVLEMARKERGFSETARQLHAKAAHLQPLWYPLVQNFFLVQEKGQSGIGWLKRG